MLSAPFTPDFLSRLECLKLRTRKEVLGGRPGSPSLPPSRAETRVAILNELPAVAGRARKVLEEQLDTFNKLSAALLCRAFRGELLID
ncbi:MAG: hypothetical protein IH857_01310 [Deltaproteobacteria bacterium]|nr:hypothetical protein [Deltaproteobacteria bacterium]